MRAASVVLLLIAASCGGAANPAGLGRDCLIEQCPADLICLRFGNSGGTAPQGAVCMIPHLAEQPCGAERQSMDWVTITANALEEISRETYRLCATECGSQEDCPAGLYCQSIGPKYPLVCLP